MVSQLRQLNKNESIRETKAIARYIRMSPHKVRRVLDQIRGRQYREALIILEFMPYKACEPVLKVLRSAVANAEHNDGLDPTTLVVSKAFADGGPALKRYRPRAQGRAYQIRKPTCHITIAVAPLIVSEPEKPRRKQKNAVSPKPVTSSKEENSSKKDTNTEKQDKTQKETKEDFMNKIDAYLVFKFKLIEEKLKRESKKIPTRSTDEIRLDMLIQVKDKSWKHENIPDFEQTFRLGQSVGCLGSKRTIEALQKDPGVIYVEASRAGSDWNNNSSSNSPSNKDISKTPIPVAVKADKIHQFEKGNKAIIGIIDSGIDVLHEAFLDSTGTQTRILAIWDLTDNTGSAPDFPDLEKSGTEHTQEQINEYIRNRQVPPNLDRDSRQHGTHVASIAAGKAGKHFLGGIAPEAKIIVVKVNPEDSRGIDRSYGLAITYIKLMANKLELPVVINISQGYNQGPHDGKSNLENLINRDFLGNGAWSGYAAVVSAGNERDKDRHAKFTITPTTDCELLFSSYENSREMDSIQLWFDSAHKLKLCLENPSGETTDWITANKEKSDTFKTDNLWMIKYNQSFENNGDSFIDVFIGKCSDNINIEEGGWKLVIRKDNNLVPEAKEIHAWIERANTQIVCFSNHTNSLVTLTTPGTAENIVVVGSVKKNSENFAEDSESSCGPTRNSRKKPDLVAPGVNIYAAQAGTNDEICLMSGTSMAAPHVTGAIALLFSAMLNQRPSSPQVTSSQICAAIRKTQDNSMSWDCERGYGVLDVNQLLSEFGLISSSSPTNVT